MRYVINYTNDKTVQEHLVYYLVSRVNILLQGKIQRITPTSPVQFQLLYSIMSEESFVLTLGVNFIHVRNYWNFLFCLNEISIRFGFSFLNGRINV